MGFSTSSGKRPEPKGFAESALWLSGIVDGKPQKGEAEMHLVDSHRIVTLEIWNT